MEKDEPTRAPGTPPPYNTPPPPPPSSNKLTEQQIRVEALRAASRAMSSAPIAPSASQVLAMAEQFANYIKGTRR